jgi:hypothetical protein
VTRSDEKWLDEQELTQLESTRAIYDLDGWAESPVKTFAGGHSAPWVDGDVSEDDLTVAAGIRERIWRAKGVKETR